MDEAAALKKFEQAYRGTGISVRFSPEGLTSWRWQAGINGGEQFKLFAWAVTPDGLLEAISAQAKAQARKGQ
jgi:hypothetical protein